MNFKEVNMIKITFKKIIFCQYLINEDTCINKKCKYSHSNEEKTNAINYYKEQRCTGWLKNNCKFGKKCFLFHGFKNFEKEAKINCNFIKNIILMRKFPDSFDILENRNIMIKLNNKGTGFIIVNEKGKAILDINPNKNTFYDIFKIKNNYYFICSSYKILMISKLPKIDELNQNRKIMRQFRGRQKNINFSKLSYKIKNDIFKILPKDNILLLN